MTIVVIWEEAGIQWCAADTRTIAGVEDKPTTEMAAKIFSISIVTAAADLEGSARIPHYRSHYGFAYAGSPLTASTTAVTASTLLQRLTRPGEKMGPPRFEEVAEFVHRIAKAFMSDRYDRAERRRADTLFSAGFFGWCPYQRAYRLAWIQGRDDGGFRVELTYPERPSVDGEPWLVLGDAAPAFNEMFEEYRKPEHDGLLRCPRTVVARMIVEGKARSVGGSVATGVAVQHEFELLYTPQAVSGLGRGVEWRRVFNGLELDNGFGKVGEYTVFALGAV